MEVSFDLSPRNDQETAANTLQSYLQSENLKWLRYFHVLVSGQPGHVPMRVAQLMFKDVTHWAQFEQENLQKTHALFDNFWLQSRRLLWSKLPTDPTYPSSVRTQTQRGGFVYQLKYKVIPEKEQALRNLIESATKPFVRHLSTNQGFIERHQYDGKSFQSEFTNLVTYEFTSMNSLATAMYGEEYQTFFNSIRPFLSNYAVVVLAPGADEHAALFWPAAGADKKAEL